MPENIKGVGSKDYTSLKLDLENKERKAETLSAQSNSSKKSDETEFLDVDFDDMSLEDVQKTVLELQTELMVIQTQLKSLEELIKSDEKIQKMYEKQYESYEAELDKLLNEVKNAETADEKDRMQLRISNIKSSMGSLSMQIQSAINLIYDHKNMSSSLKSEYSKTNMNYQSAMMAQNSKLQAQALANAQAAASLNSASGISSTPNAQTTEVAQDASATPKGASTGRVSDNMLNALKNWEGLRTTAYRCPAGVWTIGYGHTKGVSEGQTISEAQAEQYLRQDLQSFENEVTNMANAAGVKLSQGQFYALVSFAYNCGGGALQKSGILGMLKTEEGKKPDIAAAANKMNEYVHGGGQVLPGLVSRRKTESSWLYA